MAVSFHSAEWIFQKEMALKKRRPKEGKVGGELQITQKYGTEGPTNIQGEAGGVQLVMQPVTPLERPSGVLLLFPDLNQEREIQISKISSNVAQLFLKAGMSTLLASFISYPRRVGSNKEKLVTNR